jgi:hypothetical protein
MISLIGFTSWEENIIPVTRVTSIPIRRLMIKTFFNSARLCFPSSSKAATAIIKSLSWSL